MTSPDSCFPLYGLYSMCPAQNSSSINLLSLQQQELAFGSKHISVIIVPFVAFAMYFLPSILYSLEAAGKALKTASGTRLFTKKARTIINSEKQESKDIVPASF